MIHVDEAPIARLSFSSTAVLFSGFDRAFCSPGPAFLAPPGPFKFSLSGCCAFFRAVFLAGPHREVVRRRAILIRAD